MPRDIWFISDTHFGHKGIIAYGKRPFSSVEEMDAVMTERWRETVKADDLVYHLGDIAWKPEGLRLFDSLPGTKRLILGNHDDVKMCAPLVQKIELFRMFDNPDFIISHMAKRMEPDRLQINVHGHVHLGDVNDPRYINICVERTDYRPVHFEDLKVKVNEARALAKAARI